MAEGSLVTKGESIGLIALLGVLGYFLYKAVSAVSSGASAGADAVTTGIADLWLGLDRLILGPQMQVSGTIQLPDGSTLPIQGQDVRSSADGSVVYLSYNGHYYQLAPYNSAGYYPATLVQ